MTARPASTTRVSVDDSGLQSDGASFRPSLSGDGRFVAYYSEASNLVSGDTNGAADVFLFDRRSGAAKRVSVAGGGGEANADSERPALSGSGRLVIFESDASNLVTGDTNQFTDVFVHDPGATTAAAAADPLCRPEGDRHATRCRPEADRACELPRGDRASRPREAEEGGEGALTEPQGRIGAGAGHEVKLVVGRR